MQRREKTNVFSPVDMIAEVDSIELQTESLTSHVPHIRIHPISLKGSNRSVCVRTPVVLCHNVVRTSDNRAHLLLDITDDNIANMITAIDDRVVSCMARIYNSDADILRIRYLSAMHGKNRRKMKVHIPMIHDVVQVGVFDEHGKSINADTIWDAKCANVVAIVDLEAAWVLDEAGWMGCNWKLRQILIKDVHREPFFVNESTSQVQEA